MMIRYFVKILFMVWILFILLSFLLLIWGNEKGIIVEKVYLFFIVGGVVVFYIFILFVYIKIFCEVV